MPNRRTPDAVIVRTLKLLEQYDGNKHAVSRASGVARAMIRAHIRMAKERGLTVNSDSDKQTSRLKATASELRKSKVFVVTSAQNDTGLHVPFWQALLKYCELRDAQMLVIPTFYKNPDAYHPGDRSADYTWPAETLPYLLDRDISLSDSLMVLGDAKINATSVNPLGGMEPLSGVKSSIFGHAQVQMRMVATPASLMPKMLHTTGTVSKKNYSRTKEGKKAKFHHTYGALVVEISGSRFWVRELQCDDSGGFYDLDGYYTGEGATYGHRLAALVLGDEHVKFSDPAVIKATFGPGGLVDVLRPKYLVRHDIHDHYSQSHHHEHDTILKIQKAHAGDWSVRDELDIARQHLIDTTPADCENWIIQSNHHDHIYKWINRFDANKDPHNGVFAWKLKGYIADAIERGEDPDPFKLFLKNTLPDELLQRTRFIGANDRALIADIDVSQHGDRGPNGARPSPLGFARAMHKMMTAHTHVPGIEKGCYTVGTSTKSMQYVMGLSSWMITHGAIYQNGKRALMHVVEGDWRLPVRRTA